MRTFARCALPTRGATCTLHAKRTCAQGKDLNFELLLSAETKKAVEGLDPQLFGFHRAKCPCSIPPEGMMAMKDHLFVGTAVEPTQWQNKMQNVPDMKTFQASMKGHGGDDMNLTGYHNKNIKSGAEAIHVQQNGDHLQISQYTSAQSEFGCLPWKSKSEAVTVRDRSDEIFLFVCTHKSRDARCGYCGPILVDLFQQKIARLGHRVNIFPCSHFGGHVYAANLLVFTKHIGHAYGLFRPEDVDPLLESLISGRTEVPDVLEGRVRGTMALKTKVRPSL